MTFSHSISKRLVYLLSAVTFFGATQGQAYGLRDCPTHDAVSSPTVVEGSHEPDASPRAVGPRSADRGSPEAHDPEGHHRHPGGACTCLEDCNVGASTLAPIADPALRGRIPDTPSVAAGPHRDDILHGPRHRLFELHLPNAPPLPV